MSLIDADFLRPFLEGTVQTLQVQCGIQVKPGKAFLKDRAARDAMQIDIAGIIGITSKSFIGSVALCFPSATFLRIMGKLLGEERETIDKEVEDGASELLNIIFGVAKRALNDKGYAIQQALPSVATGLGLRIHHLSLKPTLVVPFGSELGAFQVEISIQDHGGRNGHANA